MNAAGVLAERTFFGLEPLPILEDQFICISWPKTTKEVYGTTICLLVRRVNFKVKDETWNNFTPMAHKPDTDDKISNALEKDGLKLGEWVTVPDPFEDEWPFEKRHPVALYPPERAYEGCITMRPPPAPSY